MSKRRRGSTPHLDGLARQIAADANRRLSPRANPFGDRSYSEDVVGIDPVTLSMILALLQFVAKTCAERRMVRKMRVYPRMAMARAYRIVDTHESTKDLALPARIAIAEAMIDVGTRANDATISLIEQEIGWAEVTPT